MEDNSIWWCQLLERWTYVDQLHDMTRHHYRISLDLLAAENWSTESTGQSKRERKNGWDSFITDCQGVVSFMYENRCYYYYTLGPSSMCCRHLLVCHFERQCELFISFHSLIMNRWLYVLVVVVVVLLLLVVVVPDTINQNGKCKNILSRPIRLYWNALVLFMYVMALLLCAPTDSAWLQVEIQIGHMVRHKMTHTTQHDLFFPESNGIFVSSIH